jgi:thioesterase domain-containing protein
MPGFSFRPRARALAALGRWPVYAIESFDTGDAGTRSLHLIATRRVAAIRAVQPRGPYRLSGYSSGGLIALEIGRQLLAAGEVVDVVVLFDSAMPRSRRSVIAYERRWMRASARWGGRGLRARLHRAKHIVYFTAGLYGLVPAWVARRRRRHETPGKRAREDVRAELGAVLRDGYQLEPYEGRVLYVHAIDQMRAERAIGMEDAEGFARAVTGSFSIAPVPGTHSSLLEPGSVDAVAAVVAAELKDFDLGERVASPRQE